MRILIIEDEPHISSSLKKGLELNAHTVDIALDGEVGYDLASSDSYDVIVLDWMLPKLSGLNLCRQLRQDGIHTPILMLTAKNDVDNRVEGLEMGADDYLTKPFSFAELLARIKALHRRPRQTQDSTLTLDNLNLNPGTVTVTRAGQPVFLSKKEFALLEFLVRHPGQIFTKDQLIEKVWNYDSDALPNTAQVYVGYLRAKIDRAFPQEKPLVHTLRGFGYKLDTHK